MKDYHPVVMVLAAVGAVVLAFSSSEKLFGDHDCCDGSKWQSHSASYKRDELWGRVIQDTTSDSWPTITLGDLFIESMDVTFDRVADDLPWDRSKLIHSVGNVAQVTWQALPAASAYTGILGAGGSYGLIRLSPAAKPDPSKGTNPELCDPQCGFIPGMGLKMLRTGVLSGNIAAMFSLEGQPSFNFFKNNFTNHPPQNCSDLTGSLRLLYNKFATASNWPTFLGLSQLAAYDENGVEGKPPVFPFMLQFVPNRDLQSAFPDAPGDDPTSVLAEQLATIPSGTLLYTIMAQATPSDRLVEIGTLTTSSGFTTSDWGDRWLFMQHTRMEDDLALHPEWKDAVTACP